MTRMILVALMSSGVACAEPRSSLPALSCRVAVDVGTECTGTPSLREAQLRLRTNATFELVGRYEACYDVDDVRLEGTFDATAYENGVDLELLAERGPSEGAPAARLERTIGFISLNTVTWEGRFTDIAATIRARGQMVGPAPNLPMMCSRE